MRQPPPGKTRNFRPMDFANYVADGRARRLHEQWNPKRTANQIKCITHNAPHRFAFLIKKN
eukprot:3613356-Pyramimonas_sp.AAC.1